MFVEYSKSKRCQCLNITNKICNNREHKFYIYKMRRVCTIHFKILFENLIIIIQRIYLGYICRKKLNYFYKRLPDDIQYKIKYFMNEELYIRKFNNNLIFVINKKLNKFIINLFNILDEKNIGYPISQLENYLLNEYNIIENYRLLIKYYKLINKSILINMQIIWLKIFDYYTNINKYYFDNNLNNNQVLFKLINIEDKIRYYINKEANFINFI